VVACVLLFAGYGYAAQAAPEPADGLPADPCAGDYMLCDDFNEPTIDTRKWVIGNTNIAEKYPVRPENVSLGTHADNGIRLTVVDASIYGDLHAGPHRQGGLLSTAHAYGAGRYEVRMKPLPGPHGCSCIWNYYDSLYEPHPTDRRVYTEIDIEMPAHLDQPPDWATWRKTLSFNSWNPRGPDATYTAINWLSKTVDPFDGKFHVFRWDWDTRQGQRRIDWYVDGVLQTSTVEHVSLREAPLWVGNWPAPWAGMDYAFDTMHLYIDWVRISAL
jgi:hypothetical protein